MTVVKRANVSVAVLEVEGALPIDFTGLEFTFIAVATDPGQGPLPVVLAIRKRTVVLVATLVVEDSLAVECAISTLALIPVTIIPIVSSRTAVTAPPYPAGPLSEIGEHYQYNKREDSCFHHRQLSCLTCL